MTREGKERPSVVGCGVFGGRSPRTGKRVGERHRWDGGGWGLGRCDFCGRTLDQVLTTKPHGAEAGVNRAPGGARSTQGWGATYWDGKFQPEAGWYISRKGPGVNGTQWMMGADGKIVRADSAKEADAIIDAAEAGS